MAYRYFLDDVDWNANDWESDDSIDEIPAVRPNSPKYLFDKSSDFARRHGNGTEAEFKVEKSMIKSFNRKLRVFYAWPIIVLGNDGFNNNWLFLVQPGADDSMLPKEGETCMMKFPPSKITYRSGDDDGKKFHGQTRFVSKQAYRVDNPCSQWAVKDDYWERAMAFEVAIPIRTKSPFKPIIKPETAEKGFTHIPRPKEFELQVAFELRLSYSTIGAELHALDKFKEALDTRPPQLSSEMIYRRPAFEYLLKFQPQAHRSLFQAFPHLEDPFIRPESVPTGLMNMFKTMNSQQIAAYKDGLRQIPDRVCFVPGGPGAGKTYWNICLTAALQSKHEMVDATDSAPRASRNQVLYLIDINRSATDVANKLVEMYKKLGLKRNVIRMYCWSDEMNSSTVNLLETQKQELYHRIARKSQGDASAKKDGPLSKYDKEEDKSEKTEVRRLPMPIFNPGCRSKSHYKDEKASRRAPTLEEAVTAFYEEHKEDTTYADIKNLSCVNSTDLQDLRNHLVERVYRDFLKVTDVIVTTPVTASKFASSLKVFDPKLVIFDEAPHARELSIMIPIAHFSPVAWIFTGDHRQTKPYVGSYGPKRNVNKHVLQLRTSTMERAFRANPSMPSLLINHRARGNLHQPASSMFYGSKMISAVKPETPGAIPPSTKHLQDTYIMPLKSNQEKQVSRMLTVLVGYKFNREESRIQGSLFNEAHQNWVERLVARLIKDPKFLQTNGKDRGTILIMSPYKRAVIEYGKMINIMRRQKPSGLNGCIVEARTVDTAQGYEADFVIIDFVSDWVTKHLEDPNRLCVALTRARQAEVIVMHPEMEDKLSDYGQFDDGPLAEMLARCKVAGEFTQLKRRV